MALSWEETTGTAGQTTVAVNIAYLDKSDIHLEINDVEVTGFTWASDTLITLPSTTTIAAGDKIDVIRKTARSVLRLLFSEGAAFTRDNIDEQNDQFLYLAQELVEGKSIDGFYGDISMNGYNITDLGDPSLSTDAANKGYVDDTVDAAQTAITADLTDRISRTVRAPSGSLNAIRGALINRLLAFDANGQPYTMSAATGSATDLARALASDNEGEGMSLVSAEDGTDGQEFYERTNKVLGDYGSGPYTLDANNKFITYKGRVYRRASDSDTFTTTGTTAATWVNDSKYLKMAEPFTSTPISNSDLRTIASLEFGGKEKAILRVDSAGILKVGARNRLGMPLAEDVTVPYVTNTGRLITTDIGKFPEKQLYLPSTNYEDVFQSPSFGITYDSTGKPSVALITPTQTLSGSAAWPDQTRQGKTFWNFAFLSDITGSYQPVPTSWGTSSSARYLRLARWTVSSLQYNTELKFDITSANTSDNFLGTLSLEANVQSSGTLFATTTNLTQANLTKYFKVKFDGPRDRLPSNSAVGNVPSFGCTSDGTYLYLWVYLPAGQSSPKLTPRHLGTGSGITVDYTGATSATSAPSGYTIIPTWASYNGLNASVANDGAIVASDNHVRICNSSGSYSARTDIASDGFLWGGYGTYKSNREACTITRSSTGVYVVTGPHISSGWLLRQPVTNNGEEAAIARITSTSSDGLTNTITVYAVKYTYNSSTGVVTKGIGDVMDIPSGSWVDMHASTTF